MIKIKNAAMAKNKKVECTANKQIVAVAQSLKKLGFLEEVKKDGRILTLSLAFKEKRPVLINLKLISKPGLRIYQGVEEIEGKKGPSTLLVSTPKGILSSREVIKQRAGGEVIAEIW